MLKSLSDILGYRLNASDGELGSIKDFFFDDSEWNIRYFIVNTRKWLPGRKVLISPAEISKNELTDHSIPVSLTKEQVKNSPNIQSDLPVSRQNEIELMNYYGWTRYWGPINQPSMGKGVGDREGVQTEADKKVADWDPNLRSAAEVTGYDILSKDDEAGMLIDLIVETSDWNIRYLVVDLQKWRPGKKSLVSSAWVNYVDGVVKKVAVELDSEVIKNSPEYCSENPIIFEYEAELFNYYLKSGK